MFKKLLLGIALSLFAASKNARTTSNPLIGSMTGNDTTCLNISVKS